MIQQLARHPWLYEIPVTQQHCITDCAKKHGTNHEANQPQHIVGMIGGKRREHHTNEADCRGNAVQHRVAASECNECNDCQPRTGRLTNRYVIERKPERHADERNSRIHASQQLAVSHRDLTGSQCEPQKEHASTRPLQHHGCGVELHSTTSSRGVVFIRWGPASVATTMSSSRMPHLPAT